jgi:hypothetical protein
VTFYGLRREFIPLSKEKRESRHCEIDQRSAASFIVKSPLAPSAFVYRKIFDYISLFSKRNNGKLKRTLVHLFWQMDKENRGSLVRSII